MKQVDEERFAALVSWATSHGATIHPAVEIYKDDVTGFSVRVKPEPAAHEAAINSQPEILACPLQTSLSYLNACTGGSLHVDPSTPTESSPTFPPEFMKLPPHIIGRFFLIQQYLLGKASFWYPYIATLPQPDALSSWTLPPFWPGEDAGFLEGTNTGIAAQEIRDVLKKEFKDARRILKEADFQNWQDYTKPLHNWAFSMFSSRSFRPSLVIPKAIRDNDLPRHVEIDDFSILLPVFDIVNHSMNAQVRWLVDDESSNAKVCRFQTFDSYQPGDQVFNSYGRKTNSELLLSYGFLLPETEEMHNDYVHLRKKAGGAVEAAAGVDAPGKKPQDFLVSLRPMNHPSSFAGRTRQLVAKDPEFDIRPEFAHVEDGLILDLCFMIVGEENKTSFVDRVLGGTETSAGPHPAGISNRREQELESLRRILSASQPLPHEVQQVVAKAKEILLAKLGMEYDKLCETDPGAAVDEDGNEVVVEIEPKTDAQELAMLYRQQAREILENAIAALVPDWQAEAADEQE